MIDKKNKDRERHEVKFFFLFLTCIYFKPLLTNAAGTAAHAKAARFAAKSGQSCTMKALFLGISHMQVDKL